MVQPCDGPEPIGPGADMGGLLRFSIDLSLAFRECRARHDALARWATRPAR